MEYQMFTWRRGKTSKVFSLSQIPNILLVISLLLGCEPEKQMELPRRKKEDAYSTGEIIFEMQTLGPGEMRQKLEKEDVTAKD